MRTSLVDRIAERLSAQLATYPHVRLPPLRSMAADHGVSVATMAKAARKLEAVGILHMGRGRRIEVAANRNPKRHVATSAETLQLSLRQRILNGYIRVGEPLPKMSYIAAESRVSVHTVLQAYRMLEEKNMAFKRGRTWIAGPKPDSYANITTQNPPVILLLQVKEGSWRSLYSASRTAQFCRTFTSEAEERAVRLLPVFAAPFASPGGVFAGGMHEVVQVAIRLGTRYLGTLIAASTTELPDLAQWGKVLAQLGKPVVWFDRYDQPLEDEIDPNLFTRCHFSEDRAIAEAVEFLYESGHRTVGYADLYVDDWRRRRFEMLAASATRYGREMRFVRSKQYGNWSLGAGDETERILQALLASDLRPIRKIIDVCKAANRTQPQAADSQEAIRNRLLSMISSLRRDTSEISEYYQYIRIILYAPVLADLLSVPDITAIVVPHDWDGRHMFYTLETSGLQVPSSLSLLSFDNSNLVHPLPVSSVDFGFGYLGFCAFHLLLQDVHIDRDSKGNVPARARVINRGSVGMPRRKELLL